MRNFNAEVGADIREKISRKFGEGPQYQEENSLEKKLKSMGNRERVVPKKKITWNNKI
jgi:hypothetical protein